MKKIYSYDKLPLHIYLKIKNKKIPHQNVYKSTPTKNTLYYEHMQLSATPKTQQLPQISTTTKSTTTTTTTTTDPLL